MSGNREYKSDVFSMLLQEPENALSVYNALNGSDYRDPAEVQIYRIERGIRLSVRNDSSFIIDNYLSLYEHQSSPNPNMPLRFLIYVTELFKATVKNTELYSSRLKKIPTPKFVVFYNGLEARPEIEYLKLSDAFEHPTKTPDLELKCKVYNINPGNNQVFLKKCAVLEEYTAFVERVRLYQEKYPMDDLGDVLDRAIDSCIEDQILAGFLTKHRAEVKQVIELDCTFESRLQYVEEEKQEIIQQWTAEKEQWTSEKEQLVGEKEQLASENERMKKLLAEHGITA